MVFCEGLSATDFMEPMSTSSTETERDGDSAEDIGELSRDTAPYTTHEVYSLDRKRTLFSAGIIVQQVMRDISGMTMPWPPLSTDLNIDAADTMVPMELYNLIAWCTGASDEPVFDKKVQLPEDTNRRLLSICQDIVYLASSGKKPTPKSLALGLTVRHLTGSSQLLDILSRLGHCISTSSTIGFETALAEYQLATETDIPKCMSKQHPTVLVWDNIDFGEETLSGRGTTHHTNGIMVQSKMKSEDHRVTVSIRKGVRTLQPQKSVPDLYIHTKRQGPQELNVPLLEYDTVPSMELAQKTDTIYVLLKYSCHAVSDTSLPGWTGFNCSTQTSSLPKSALYYLPVIEASPTEMTTVNTILTRSVEIADRLELESIVTVYDQAIYAKAQQIRWKDQNLMQRIIPRLGEFHTAMSFMAVIGKRFKEAGLQDVLIESNVVAVGSINGVISGHHYNRSIRAHKLLFEAMHILRLRSFLQSLPEQQHTRYISAMEDLVREYKSEAEFSSNSVSDMLSDMLSCYDRYVHEMNSVNPTFGLWSSYIEMVQLLLSFIRATRDSDWSLHLATVRRMLPWYFAYDRQNYARYLSAYWVEMINLPKTHPHCYEEVTAKGNWTVQRKDANRFSSIACDQAIEQTCNRDSKTKGGITGITLNRGAVQRWILSHPERSAITRQCEMMAGMQHEERGHKELDATRIAKDNAAVLSLVSAVESMINPFLPREDLVCISSGVVATKSVRDDIQSACDKGEAALKNFIQDRVQSSKTDFFSPIKSLKLTTFGDQMKKSSKTKDGNQVILKNDRRLFARLLVISQSRSVNLKEILTYSLGNISSPLASTDGSLAKTNKAALLACLESKNKDCHVNKTVGDNGALLIDGMALIRSLKNIPDTFGELADDLLQLIIKMGRKFSCPRVDFVIDRYPAVSIKNAERSRRAVAGQQLLQIYSIKQKTPSQWTKFLASGENKEALTDFLFETWRTVPLQAAGKDIAIFVAHRNVCHQLTLKDGIMSVKEVESLTCDHEEADTRLLLHAKHAWSELYNKIIIQSPDTDVAIISLSIMAKLPSAKMYFLTGTKDRQRMLDLQAIGSALGPSVTEALIGLHTFTGCDSTSSFYGKGKEKPLNIMSGNAEYISAFVALGRQFEMDSTTFVTIERFVCELYGEKVSDVNLARYNRFCVQASSEQALPPTKDALTEHFKRANYQAAIHRRALDPFINAPSPDGFGWIVKDGDLIISWMTKDPAPQQILGSLHCGCKTGTCTGGRCSCHKADLACTDLCKCVHCDNVRLTENSVSCESDSEDSDLDI